MQDLQEKVRLQDAPGDLPKCVFILVGMLLMTNDHRIQKVREKARMSQVQKLPIIN